MYYKIKGPFLARYQIYVTQNHGNKSLGKLFYFREEHWKTGDEVPCRRPAHHGTLLSTCQTLKAAHFTSLFFFPDESWSCYVDQAGVELPIFWPQSLGSEITGVCPHSCSAPLKRYRRASSSALHGRQSAGFFSETVFQSANSAQSLIHTG